MNKFLFILFGLTTFPASASISEQLKVDSPLLLLFAVGVLGLVLSRRKLRH